MNLRTFRVLSWESRTARPQSIWCTLSLFEPLASRQCEGSVGCHWWGVYTPFDVDPKWPKLRAIDEPSSSGTDSRKRTKNVMSFKNSDTQWLAVAPVCQMQIGNSCIVECMRAILDYMLYADGRRVSHICATYKHAYNIDQATPG